MIQFLLTRRRLARALVRAWRRDPRFRSLAFLVAFTLLSGTIFYSAVERWSLVDAFYFSVDFKRKLSLISDLRAQSTQIVIAEPLELTCIAQE